MVIIFIFCGKHQIVCINCNDIINDVIHIFAQNTGKIFIGC